MILIIHRDLNI